MQESLFNRESKVTRQKRGTLYVVVISVLSVEVVMGEVPLLVTVALEPQSETFSVRALDDGHGQSQGGPSSLFPGQPISSLRTVSPTR